MNDPDLATKTLPISRAERMLRPLEQFLRVETASGLVLLIVTGMALVWANSPWAQSYELFWNVLLLPRGPSLHFAINEALMAIFFLVVGIEIRRELHDGPRSRACGPLRCRSGQRSAGLLPRP